MIVLALGLFLAAKAEFRSETSNDFLYLYGISVTSIVLVQMAVAFGRYRDFGIASPSAISAAGTASSAPFVSCIVAVHNDEEIIEQCVKSLVAQTYANKEVIIIDDASTDGTHALLERLATEHSITVISLGVNVGKKKALSVGILSARGSIYAFSDSDSIWAPDHSRAAL